MYDLETDFAPEPWLGLGLPAWIALGLVSALLWGTAALIAWRMLG